MTTPPPAPPPGQYPFPPHQPGYGPPPARPGRRTFVLGAVVGLVIGSGSLGLAWGLTSAGGGDEVEETCDMISVTEPLTKDFALRDVHRIGGLSELTASFAEDDDTYKPLADAMQRLVIAIQALALDKAEDSLTQAQEICSDL